MASAPPPTVTKARAEPFHLHIFKPWFMPHEYRHVVNELEGFIQPSQTGSGTIVLSDEAHADLSMRPGGDGKICFTLFHPDLPDLAPQNHRNEEPPTTDYFPSALRGLSDLFSNSSSESTLPLVPSHDLWGTVEPDMYTILSALRGAAHFLRCLRLSGTEQPQCTVEVHRVVEDEDAELDDELLPPFIPDGENLWRGGVLEVIPDRKTRYGLTVINNGDKPMYVVGAFCLDCSDLFIGKMQQTGTLLSPGRKLAIGHGVGSEATYPSPWVFYLREGQTRDIGFFKILISESPVEPPCLEQGSPFGKDAVAGIEKADLWPHLGVITIPMVM